MAESQLHLLFGGKLMADQVTPNLAHAQLQQASKMLEIGWMGRVFGDAAEKPGNVAAAAIVLAFIMLAVVIIVVPDTATSKTQLLTLLGSIITGALGFLFGRRK